MTSIRPWPEERRRRLARLKVFDVMQIDRRSPRNGQTHEFFVVDTWDWVNVVAFTQAGTLLLVRQFRHGTCDVTLEIPGGVVHPGEDPARTAERELLEETGCSAGAWHRLGSVQPNPAILTNRCHSYLALDCRRVGELQQDAGEDIEVVELPLAEVELRVRRGEIAHALVLNGLYLYRLHREDRADA